MVEEAVRVTTTHPYTYSCQSKLKSLTTRQRILRYYLTFVAYPVLSLLAISLILGDTKTGQGDSLRMLLLYIALGLLVGMATVTGIIYLWGLDRISRIYKFIVPPSGPPSIPVTSLRTRTNIGLDPISGLSPLSAPNTVGDATTTGRSWYRGSDNITSLHLPTLRRSISPATQSLSSFLSGVHLGPGRDILAHLRNNEVGGSTTLMGPFGPRRISYMDFTASGRALGFVEDYIRDVVAPLYSGPASEGNCTSLQTTHFLEEARAITAEALNADRGQYSLLFTGTGATGAINKLVNMLGLWLPEQHKELAMSWLPESHRPIVLVGPYEHHSNELMWRESLATVRHIGRGADGHPDRGQLRSLMEKYSSRPLKIVSLSGGSNVTGIVPDYLALTTLVHQGGFLSFWDFAGSGAYIHIDMQPSPDPQTHIDAAFFSPHKYIGGPGSCGLLVAKRSLLAATVERKKDERFSFILAQTRGRRRGGRRGGGGGSRGGESPPSPLAESEMEAEAEAEAEAGVVAEAGVEAGGKEAREEAESGSAAGTEGGKAAEAEAEQKGGKRDGVKREEDKEVEETGGVGGGDKKAMADEGKKVDEKEGGGGKEECCGEEQGKYHTMASAAATAMTLAPPPPSSSARICRPPPPSWEPVRGEEIDTTRGGYGGTPGILAAIRCGLAHRVKMLVGLDRAEALQAEYGRRAIRAWSKIPNIELMGEDSASSYSDGSRRVSIIAFRIWCGGRGAPSQQEREEWISGTGVGAGTGTRAGFGFGLGLRGGRGGGGSPNATKRKPSSLMLHHNFVVKLLNDLYGIQSRGGCSCAGPYGESIMGIQKISDTVAEANELLKDDRGESQHSIKYGWARVNFNYFLSEEQVAFTIKAVEQISKHGWRLLPQYRMCPFSGQFYHREFDASRHIRGMDESHFDLEKARFCYKMPSPCFENPSTYLKTAQKVYNQALEKARGMKEDIFGECGDFHGNIPLLPVAEAARWFILPHQAAMELGLQPPGEGHFHRNASIRVVGVESILKAVRLSIGGRG